MPIEVSALPTLYKRTAGGGLEEWDVRVENNGSDGAEIVVVYGLQGGKKTTAREKITAGKNAGKRNATTTWQQACAEAQATWNKKVERNHYGTDPTGAESENKRAQAPMLAQKYQDHSSKVQWDSAFGQPKLDGNRCLAKRDGKKITLWTRKGVQIATLPHIEDALMGVMLPGETFDGEVYVHGLHVTNLNSLLRKKQPDCARVQFRVYDMVKAAPFGLRHERLHARFLVCPGDRDIVGLELVETIKIATEAQLMQLQKQYLEEGFEGAMLRWGKFGYEAGKRSQGLLKVKTADDDEFQVFGVEEGRGTFAGMAIFICHTKYGIPFNVMAPGTHAQKREAWTNCANYVGKWLTVKYFGYTQTSEPVPFQPVAKAFRTQLD